MRTVLLLLLLLCAGVPSPAQITNYVRNPDLEDYSTCPDMWNQLVRARYWSMPIDTLSEADYAPEYYNACAKVSLTSVPFNTSFYQHAHSGGGMAGCHFYYDKTPPILGVPFDYRDYLQGRLHQSLVAGQSYCVRFWVNMAEASGYAINKIGAYLDDGSINKLPLAPGTEITSVVPQVYSSSKLRDTAAWVKIEGNFVAKGGERYITIGNFFKNSAVDTAVTNYWFAFEQLSYYLIDDISVVLSSSRAYAGPDKWVHQGSWVALGRVGDTTARGIDAYWYHKGKLMDSGAVVSVKSSSVAYSVDTYVVVQEVCGVQSRDTVLVRTVPSHIAERMASGSLAFSLYPNPHQGAFVLSANSAEASGGAQLLLYDMLGRLCYSGATELEQGKASIVLPEPLAPGAYVLHLQYAGQVYALPCHLAP